MGRVCHGPSFVMGRVCYGPSCPVTVSNNEVEKFGIPQRMHSHAILLLSDLL